MAEGVGVNVEIPFLRDREQAKRVRWRLKDVFVLDVQAPAIDEGVREAIDAYVARRKSEMPDAFM